MRLFGYDRLEEYCEENKTSPYNELVLKHININDFGIINDGLYEKSKVHAGIVAKSIYDSINERDDSHVYDNKNEYKRYFTGSLGEAYIGQIFGVDVLDLSDTDIGDSIKKNVPDLRKSMGLDLGVKTSVLGNFPMTQRKIVHYPELICVHKSSESKEILFVGFASVKMLEKFVDIRYVNDEDARDRKTGFFGFKNLIPASKIKSIKDLKNLCDLDAKGLI